MKNLLQKITICIACFLFGFSVKAQVAIPDSFFSENAWMPHKIKNTVLNGKLDSNWQNVDSSRVMMMRYGGILADDSLPSDAQYINMVDSIRKYGMDPILQASFGDGIVYDSAKEK